MPKLNLPQTRDAIQAFDFNTLFINELGWSNPHQISSRSLNVNETDYTEPAKGKLPLYEGKMIHQFVHQFADPRYWVDEKEGRKALLGKKEDQKQILGYQKYRLAYRSVARSTDRRTMIATVLPIDVFYGHSLNATRETFNGKDLLYLVAVLNNFMFDYALRQRVSANLTMFYVYQLPVPRLTEKDIAFTPIVTRAAKLICTTPEFDDLAKAVGLGSHNPIHPDERAQLRTELDGMIAHLYGLTYEEFKHILGTLGVTATSFPLVKDEVKEAALGAFEKYEYNFFPQ